MAEFIRAMNKNFDAVIIGGGMVGATAAIAFAKQGRRVALIETHMPEEASLEQAPLRVSAVNLFSESYLKELAIWPHISANASNCFKRLATWEDRNEPLMFHCDEIGQTHLGHLIRNEALQLAAFEEMKAYGNNITLFNQTVTSLQQTNEYVEVTLEQTTLKASILVGADGANSVTRKLSNIGQTGWQYQQACLSITIKSEEMEQDITWQEFQPSGPKAFLPLTQGYHSLIWYDDKSSVKALSQLDNEQLKARILADFPPLPGDFSLVQKAWFPLARTQANTYFNNRIVLVGDAAHTINPLAGQGVNLGYKDVSTLCEKLKEVDLNSAELVQEAMESYQRKSKAQSLLMSSMMDVFYQLFSNESSTLSGFRQAALKLAGKAQFAKKWVLNKAVGF